MDYCGHCGGNSGWAGENPERTSGARVGTDQQLPGSRGRTMSSALTLSGVSKSFGLTEVIRGVDLDVQAGECHAIIGPNGAGKSTLFNLITGRFPVTEG